MLKRVRLALIALLLGGVGAAHAAPPVPPMLTLAVPSIAFAAPALIAESESYFAAEGVAVKIVRCAFGRVCLKQMLDGQAQLAIVAETPITFASFTRTDFSIVATLSTSGREHRMVVRTDRGIATAADLKGKRIGTLRGTSGHYFTETFLRFSGIAPSDVTVVALDADDAVGALARGEIDAAGLFDPHGADALARLGGSALALRSPGFFYVTYNLVSMPAPVGGDDEQLVKLLRALKRADTLIHAEPERARALVAAALKIEPARFEALWKDYDFRLQLSPQLVSALEAQSRWALREKLVPADARLPDYLNFIRSAPLRRVDARAVRLLE